MAMYNSSILSDQDDTDATMISHSLFYDRPTVTKNINNPTYFNDRNNHIFEDDDPYEAAQQIEQILDYYRKELKQESYTQLDCNRKLITRLFDFIRPTYTTNKKKMNDINAVFQEISELQDLRFLQQKEKHEQLTSEILHLKKLIITSANDGFSSKNTLTKVYRINSMVDYEQWVTMEEETRKLQNLVELQRDRINELIKLLSPEETVSVRAPTFRNIVADFDECLLRKRHSTTPNSSTERLLVATIKSVFEEQHDSGTDTLQRSINELHSLDSVNNETSNAERLPLITSTLPPISRFSSYNDIKKCPICNYEFFRKANEFEIIHHVETCLSSAGIDDPGIPTEPKQYACPNCHRQYQDDDEKAYLEHLAYCYSEYADTF